MPRKTEGRKSVTTQVSDETHSLLKAYAEENYWSLSKAVEVLVEKGLKGFRTKSDQPSKTKRSKEPSET
jgi:hypothetical protein